MPDGLRLYATFFFNICFFFFFQAEDGIRDYKVTGVQTCALPISPIPDANDSRMSAIPYEANLTPMRVGPLSGWGGGRTLGGADGVSKRRRNLSEIGRASCRERV